MGLPVGVATCTLTFGSALDWAGGDLSITAQVTPTHDLVWAATGQPLLSFPLSVQAAAGVPGQVVLPVTDQTGFLDSAGDAFTGWAYSITLTFRGATGMKSVTKAVQPITGQSVIDLDLVPSGSVTTPVSAPIPDVISVNGQTGVVVISTGGGEGGAVDSVNGQTGVVSLDAGDVGADPAGTASTAVGVHSADTTAVHGIANTANLVLTGDARLSNSRTPTAHATSHADGGADELALDGSQITSGTVADARIAATIARDAEVTAAVAVVAGDLADHEAVTTTAHGGIPQIVAVADADWPPAAPVEGVFYLHLDA